MKQQILTAIIHLLSLSLTATAVDFLFNSFNTLDLLLIDDARSDSSIVHLTNDSNYYSIGRTFFPSRLHLSTGPNRTPSSSFSTSFVFSILPEIQSSPGFSLAFVLSNSTSPISANSGQYFGGPRFQINVTMATAEDPRPPRPLISYTNLQIANYVLPEMFVSFSTSKVKWVEAQRILAWSLSDTDGAARELNTTDLPIFLPPPSIRPRHHLHL